MNDELIPSDRARADAVTHYRQLMERFPEEDSHLLALAWALHDAGMRHEDTDCFELLFRKELKRSILTGFAFDELVRIYREDKRWEDLLFVCRRAVAVQPEDIGLRRTLGEAYLAGNHPDDALMVFEELTSREPDAPDHWCALGNALIAAGNPARAEEVYSRAAAMDPVNAPIFFSRLADGLLRAGYLTNAQGAVERSLSLTPRAPLYRTALGDILVRQGRPADAMEAYAGAASLEPAYAGVFWFRLGNLLEKEGLHSSGAEAFTKAVAAEPGNPRYLLSLAASYAAQGLAELAGTILAEVEEISAAQHHRSLR